MKEKKYAEAINEALEEEMLRDDRVILIGEDIGTFGGIYKTTRGLLGKFGPERVRDTPISEDGFVGAAIGAATTGLRPIVEIMYLDFILCCMNQLVNHAAKLHYMTGGALSVPMVIRTTIIQGRHSGADHAQAFIPIFMHIPGLFVVTPSTPEDAKGLLKMAIRKNAPTICCEAASLYGLKGPVQDSDYLIPFGKASIKKEGNDVTLVGVSSAVHVALSAAEKLEAEGVHAEVIDPRTLVPLDIDTIVNSVRKTGRLVTVEDSWRTCGVGAEIAALTADRAFSYLEAPIVRLGMPPIPEPVSPPLLKLLRIEAESVIEAVKRVK
jgi:pyruvate dehydrogenase E1 component beta subunit